MGAGAEAGLRGLRAGGTAMRHRPRVSAYILWLTPSRASGFSRKQHLVIYQKHRACQKTERVTGLKTAASPRIAPGGNCTHDASLSILSYNPRTNAQR